MHGLLINNKSQIIEAVTTISSLYMTIIYIVIGLGMAMFVIGWFLVRRKTSHPNDSTLALQAERLKSDIIVNSIDDGVVVIDNQKVIQIFNPAAGRLTGWKPTEAIHLDYSAVLKLVDDKNVAYPENQDPFNQALQNGKATRDNNASVVSRDNKPIPVNISVSPLFDSQKRLSGAVGILGDASQARAEERQRAEFISTASHEMRTPVAAIEGYLSLAMNDKVSQIDTKAREYLEKAHTSTQHLGKLFQDLLTSAKAEDGRLTSEPTVLEMSAYLEQLTEEFKFSAEKKGLTLEYIVGASHEFTDARDVNSKVIKPLYYVYADPDRLHEVVGNIFDNALKYTESGKVSLGLTGNKEVVQLYIKDTGPGIAATDIPHLFQKFYRVNSSMTRSIGGTGLGLFISRKIIELYNGRIWVESDLGHGSTFFINLPRLDNQKAIALQASQKSSAATSTAPVSTG
jgi:two-component system sensor histidine kinase VicK